ncbi:MAG: hypothetical protein KBT05_07765, partial [Bacteroidales bacterium]|nr:hypothetical protein [Candidatus Cryptobacteroides caccocaballi]
LDYGTPTTIWQPLPEGPVITIPAGSTNIPVTSTENIKVGDKLAIGYGSSFPNVNDDIAKYEVVTVTKVGKPGTQAYLSMDAKPGDRNIKISSTENISVGDKIRLDIDSEGHGVEWVTVKKVGTPSARNTLSGPLKPGEDPGTGLELKEKLKYHHASNMPISVNGTGVSFTPASKYDHSSNEPVLALVYAIELDEPLSRNHEINDIVFDAKVKTAGYQDEVKADQLFGGPALSTHAASIILRDAKGLVADALNYGRVVDPWVSEGYHGESGFGKFGNVVDTPFLHGDDGYQNPTTKVAEINLSAGRYPDGADADDNIKDFKVQKYVALAASVAAGEKTIKVNDVNAFRPGQTIHIGKDGLRESAIVGSVGSPGSTTLAEDAKAGSKQIIVKDGRNFHEGQIIVVGGLKYTAESIIIAPRPMFWLVKPGDPDPVDTIKLNKALSSTVKAGGDVSGTGILLATPLKSAHAVNDPVIDNIPTPGRPNMYL